MKTVREKLVEATVYGLRCGELGDAPGEKHSFVLESDYREAIGELDWASATVKALLPYQDRAVAAEREAAQMRAALVRSVHVAKGLHGMISQETWRANGAEWMGQYEGDYHAEQIAREIEEWAALAAGGEP